MLPMLGPILRTVPGSSTAPGQRSAPLFQMLWYSVPNPNGVARLINATRQLASLDADALNALRRQLSNPAFNLEAALVESTPRSSNLHSNERSEHDPSASNSSNDLRDPSS